MDPSAPRPAAGRPDRPRRRPVLGRLKSKYRLLLINDRTFEERFSMRLSRMNMILLGACAFLLIAVLVSALIVFTPLRERVPGYADHDLTRFAYRSARLADSLARVLPAQQAYVENLRMVLSGKVPADSTTVSRPIADPPGASELAPSRRDSLMRERVAQEEAYALSTEGRTGMGRRELAGMIFFPPLRGLITQAFDPATGHLGLDVVAKADEAVKAALDGSVVLASWTSDAGNVIQVQHANDLLTVYKHNSVLLKKVGDRVRAGEAIAIVGGSGELSDGPHLHFELWLAGEPIDPAAYMVFQ